MSGPTTSLDVTWQNPTFLLPLFSACVLLASTDSLTLAISTAVVMLAVTVTSSILIVLLTRVTKEPPTVIAWLLCASTLTALLELLVHAWFYTLYQQLGLFLPMIITSVLLLARHEMQQYYTSLQLAMTRALLMSFGYALAAVVLGAGRELVGHGSLFNEASNLWGDWAKPLEIQLFHADMGFLLATLAPGAFIALGLGVALYNWLLLQLRNH
ncbi:MAG: Rnf-Nqr domain containing protein [Steroidobacteraceae bacterium]